MPLWLIQILVGIALSLAGQLVTAMSRQDAKERVAGVRGTMQSGGDLSPRFIVGRYGTGGQLRYAGTWGNAGETPNAYFSQVVEVSCLPIRGFAGWFLNGERVTLADTPTGDLGYAVLEYRRGGVDYFWINPYLGDQADEDPLMLAKFGADPDRPYADMVGRGCGYFVATALVNRELFSGLPEVLAEVDGIALDDPRGDDMHDNPIVAAYTLLKGLSYDGEWVYGPQGITDVNFRAANLEEEADKCDVDRELEGGGTERRFRIGLDIALEDEPHGVVGELLKGCSGRWADLGGIYRFLVGAPGAPVVSFTDSDVAISEPQELDPFPGLESLYNAVTATYPEPAEAWVMKAAPSRYSSALEAEDESRRLPLSTEFNAVPYAVQVQELMRTAIEDARRFRRHTQTMSPAWWEYEPLDAVEWTSLRNGYDAKAQLITMIEDLPNANQFVALQEIDPADYDWSAEYQLPHDTTPSVVSRPPPQEATGFQLFPDTIDDNAGTPRRPTFRVEYPGRQIDVRAIAFEVKLDGEDDDDLIVTGDFPYGEPVSNPATKATRINNVFAGATALDARFKYLPFSGRPTEWSAWLSVTTPDVGIEPADLGATLANMQDFFSVSIRDLYEQAEQVAWAAGDQDAANYADRLYVLDKLAVGDQATYAASVRALLLATGTDDSALADALSAIEAASGDVVAGVLTRMTAQASPGGSWVRYGTEIRAGYGGDFEVVSDFWEVNSVSGLSRRVSKATEQFIVDDLDNIIAVWGAGGSYIAKAVIPELTVEKLEVVARGLTFEDIVFEHNVTTVGGAAVSNRAAWTAGTVRYVDDTGAPASAAIAAGNTSLWSAGVMYIYWVKGATTFSVTTSAATAFATNNVVVGAYQGGSKLLVTWGKLVVDGSNGFKALSVVTGAIADNAVTSIVADIAASDVTFTTGSTNTTWHTIAAITVVPAGGSTLVECSAVLQPSANNAGAYGGVGVRLLRDGVAVRTISSYYDDQGSVDTIAVVPIKYRDTTAQTTSHTYTLQGRWDGTGGGEDLEAAAGSGLWGVNYIK